MSQPYPCGSTCNQSSIDAAMRFRADRGKPLFCKCCVALATGFTIRAARFFRHSIAVSKRTESFEGGCSVVGQVIRGRARNFASIDLVELADLRCPGLSEAVIFGGWVLRAKAAQWVPALSPIWACAIVIVSFRDLTFASVRQGSAGRTTGDLL